MRYNIFWKGYIVFPRCVIMPFRKALLRLSLLQLYTDMQFHGILLTWTYQPNKDGLKLARIKKLG